MLCFFGRSVLEDIAAEVLATREELASQQALDKALQNADRLKASLQVSAHLKYLHLGLVFQFAHPNQHLHVGFMGAFFPHPTGIPVIFPCYIFGLSMFCASSFSCLLL